jgi:hypothetical protein
MVRLHLIFPESTGRWPVVRGILPRTGANYLENGSAMSLRERKLHSTQRPNAAVWQPALPGKDVPGPAMFYR